MKSQKKLQNLIRLARKMCFTEKALTGTVPVSVSQKINQVPLALD